MKSSCENVSRITHVGMFDGCKRASLLESGSCCYDGGGKEERVSGG